MRIVRFCSSVTEMSDLCMGVSKGEQRRCMGNSIGRVNLDCEVLFLCDRGEWHTYGCEHWESK